MPARLADRCLHRAIVGEDLGVPRAADVGSGVGAPRQRRLGWQDAHTHTHTNSKTCKGRYGVTCTGVRTAGALGNKIRIRMLRAPPQRENIETTGDSPSSPSSSSKEGRRALELTGRALVCFARPSAVRVVGLPRSSRRPARAALVAAAGRPAGRRGRTYGVKMKHDQNLDLYGY